MIENYKTSRVLVGIFLKKLEERNKVKSKPNSKPAFITEPRL
jgi:hypothetical protein